MKDFMRVIGTLDASTLAGELGKNVISTASEMWEAISLVPSQDFPSIDPDTSIAVNDRMNNTNHIT